jgi:hypothetical protein
MGKETAASRNVQLNCLPLKDSTKDFSPQHGMIFPAGPKRAGPEGGVEDL